MVVEEAVEVEEKKLVPEEVWDGLSRNARVVAQVLSLFPVNTTIEAIENAVEETFPENPKTVVALALEELKEKGVLEKLTPREADQRLIRQREFDTNQAGYAAEARRAEFKVALNRLQKNPKGTQPQSGYEKPYFSLNKNFKTLVLSKKVK